MLKNKYMKSNVLACKLDDVRDKILKAKQLEADRLTIEKLQAESLILNKSDNESNLFQQAIKGARPLTFNVQKARSEPQTKKPKPIPLQFLRDEHQALIDSLSDSYIPAHELESGEELLYLREGHTPDILSKLRRGYWVIQAAIDLHGLVSDEARLYVARFLGDCKKKGIRCVRIVHGKGLGSPNREPVLKHKLRNWLIQKDEVIAYAEARKQDGGSGAVIVLLKS